MGDTNIRSVAGTKSSRACDSQAEALWGNLAALIKGRSCSLKPRGLPQGCCHGWWPQGCFAEDAVGCTWAPGAPISIGGVELPPTVPRPVGGPCSYARDGVELVPIDDEHSRPCTSDLAEPGRRDNYFSGEGGRSPSQAVASKPRARGGVGAAVHSFMPVVPDSRFSECSPFRLPAPSDRDLPSLCLVLSAGFSE